MLPPREPAAVHDDSAHGRAVAAHELRQRVHHDVGAVIDRPKQDRGRDRVIDDQRHAVGVSDLRERLDVADVARGGADAFAIDGARVVIDQLLDVIGVIRCSEPDGDALARQDVGEQRVRRAVELRHRHEVAAQTADIDRRVVQRGLSAAHAQRVDPAFEGGDAPLEHRVGRVADTTVAEALGFEIEERRSVVRAVEGVRDGLIDGDGHGLCCRIDLVAAVNGDRVGFHALPSGVERVITGGVARSADGGRGPRRAGRRRRAGDDARTGPPRRRPDRSFPARAPASSA